MARSPPRPTSEERSISHPIVSTVTLVAAVSNGLATTQSLPGANGLSLNLNGSLVSGGVGVFDAPRRVIVHSDGNDTGITFTVTGTRGSYWASTAISETITGGNAADVATTQDFATVTSITASAATASTVHAGTNGTGSGPWVVWDTYAQEWLISLVGYIISGSPTWEVEYTYDDVFGLWLPAGTPFPRALTMGTMVGLTTTPVEGSLSNTGIKASRLTLTAVGSVQLTQQQTGA